MAKRPRGGVGMVCGVGDTVQVSGIPRWEPAKPRIKRSDFGDFWVCRAFGGSSWRIGAGPTPVRAYDDWTTLTKQA